MENSASRKIIRGMSITTIGTMYISLTGFVGLLIVARYVPKDEFGAYVIMQVIAAFYIILSSLAIDNKAATKLIASAKLDDKDSIANTAIISRITTDLVMVSIIYLAKPVYSLIFKSEQLDAIIGYLCFIYLLTSWNTMLGKIMQGYQEYRKIAIGYIINGTSKVVMIVIFVAILNGHIKGVICATLMAQTVELLFFLYINKHRLKLHLDAGVYRDLFKFGWPLAINNVLTFAFTKIDRFMIALMMSPISVANYEIASKIPDNSSTIYSSFQSVYFPSMSEFYGRNNVAEAEKLMNHSLRLITFFTAFATLIIFLFRKEVVAAVFTEKYMESANILPILMLTLSIALTSNILGTSLVALGLSDKPAKINVFDATTNIIGNLLLIPRFGCIGAACAALLSRSVANPVNVWYLRKANIRVKVGHYLKPLAVCVACLSTATVFGVETILQRMTIVAGYIALCSALEVIRFRDFVLILGELRKSKHKGRKAGVAV